MSLNRDVYIALFLLMACGALMLASFEIREPDYGQLSPATWPRVIIAVMAALSSIYLIQSLRAGPETPVSEDRPDARGGLGGFFAHWRNVIWVFVLFLVYLLVMPWIGMLLAGMLFAFVLLSALGGLRHTVLHLAIAVISVGGMWAIFTFALDVILPRGEWTGF